MILTFVETTPLARWNASSSPQKQPPAKVAFFNTASICSPGRAYHLFEKMDDAYCARDEGGLTLHWLVAFRFRFMCNAIQPTPGAATYIGFRMHLLL